jgi:glycosyltransferase involved in cell wall biosynthesis
MTRFGLLSTYPPTRCGLATFTLALATALSDSGTNESVIVRVDDLVAAGPSVDTPSVRVVADLHPGDVPGRAHAAEVLNENDVVVVQHEYGIYGGPDGDEVLDLMSQLTAPTIVVMHTVLASPTAHQRQVTQEIGELAGAVVAMTRTAMTLLVDEYGVPAAKVSLIPHGVDAWTAPPRARTSPNPVVLTWGLIGPGKGIEWGIRAMALLGDQDPAPVYRVLGQTHPKVVIDQGERYRDSLTALVDELGLAGRVELDGRYCELAELAAEVAAADVVLLPYDSRDQATSGVLVEAVAAGKLVIATRFPHSIELLSDGAGFLVDHEHPEQIAQAVVEALKDRARREAAFAVARAHAHANSWPAVALRYAALADELSSVSVGN